MFSIFSSHKHKSSSRLNIPNSDIAFHSSAWCSSPYKHSELGFSLLLQILKFSAETAGALFLRQIHWQYNTEWELSWITLQLQHNSADSALPECLFYKTLQETWKFQIDPETGKLKWNYYILCNNHIWSFFNEGSVKIRFVKINCSAYHLWNVK